MKDMLYIRRYNLITIMNLLVASSLQVKWVFVPPGTECWTNWHGTTYVCRVGEEDWRPVPNQMCCGGDRLGAVCQCEDRDLGNRALFPGRWREGWCHLCGIPRAGPRS